MSIRHFLSPLLLLTLAAPGFAEEVAPKKQPKIEVASELIEVGVVDRGESPKVAVRYRNSGTAPLEVTPSLGKAITLVAPPAPTPPGQEGSFEVVLDTLPADGETVWRLGLRTNDPDNALVHLQVAANVKTYFSAQPRELRWITLRGETPATLTAIIQALGDESWKVAKATSPTPGIRLETAPGEPKADGKATWKVMATLDPAAHLGPVEGSILVELDHPKQRRMRIPVSGFVRPAVAFPGEPVDYGEHTRSAMKEKPLAVQMRYFSERQLPIRSVKVAPAVFDAEVGPREDPRFGFILLRANETTPDGEVFATVTVEFEDPLIEAISGQVRVMVEPDPAP